MMSTCFRPIHICIVLWPCDRVWCVSATVISQIIWTFGLSCDMAFISFFSFLLLMHVLREATAVNNLRFIDMVSVVSIHAHRSHCQKYTEVNIIIYTVQCSCLCGDSHSRWLTQSINFYQLLKQRFRSIHIFDIR